LCRPITRCLHYPFSKAHTCWRAAARLSIAWPIEMNWLPLDDAHQAVAAVNAEDATRIQALVRELRANRAIIEACRRYAAAITAPLVGDVGGQPRDPAGARAVVEILSRHPTFADGRALVYAEAVFGPRGTDPAEFRARRETAEFIVVGLSALAFEDPPDEQQVGALLTVAIGADAFSRRVRALVLGLNRGLDLDLDGFIPPDLIDPEELELLACMQGIQGAALALGAGVQRARAWATGIERLDPRVGCAGDPVVIRGSRFGSKQPKGVVVMFSARAGGCVAARVSSWTNTAIKVVVPESVGVGCVGFAEAATPVDLEAASHFAAELERCIGPAAFPVAAKIRRLGVAAPPPCPACLSGGANRFRGGKPVIDYLTANFGADDVTVEPDQHVVLRWSVQNARSLKLTRVSVNGPGTPPGPLPASGTLDLLQFMENTAVTASYLLEASNGCGVEQRALSVSLRRIPRLVVDAIEVVQVIQKPDNSVRLVSGKRTVARVFVDSGLSDGFDYDYGPNVLPLEGKVVVYPQAQGYGKAATPVTSATALAVPASSRDRGNARHSFTVELPLEELDGQVRVEAQVWVPGHEADPVGRWRAVGSTTVTFNPTPSQEVLPILLVDRQNMLPAPTLAAYNAALEDALKRLPLGEVGGFTLNPELTLPASTPWGSPYDLSNPGDWGKLLDDIRAIIFLFPSTAVGGIRTAMLPRNDNILTDAAGKPITDATGKLIPQYAMNGVAKSRAGALAPTFICQASLPGTFAHELGHTCAVDHAPCPAPPGTPGTGDCMDPPDHIDPRLPARTDEVGFDVRAGKVIPAGRGELMSYCGDFSRCADGPPDPLTGAGPTRWPSIVTWDMIYNHLPVG
jgi:hypothetical protein